MLIVADYIASADERRADIGIRTFDEIDATYTTITGVDRLSYSRQVQGQTVFPVEEAYQELRQSLPAVEDMEAFLSSHQVAVAQLAIPVLAMRLSRANTMWAGLDFNTPAGTFFSVGNRDKLRQTAG